MHSLLYNILLTATSTIVPITLYKVFKFFYQQLTSPLRHLPGPPSQNWIYGNIKQIFSEDNAVLRDQWVKDYGHAIRYKGFFGQNRLYMMDTVAVGYILSHTDIYQKPELMRHTFGKLLGTGVFMVEGDKHRQQRRVMNPAFGPVQVRALTSIMVTKAFQLRDLLKDDITKTQPHHVRIPNEGVRIDMLSWLSRTTLDVIGLAGFNYRFDALNETNTPNELNQAFTTMFRAGQDITAFRVLQALIPPLRVVATHQDRTIKTARKTMDRIAAELLANAKAAVSAKSSASAVEKSDIVGRDLLSLLVKANMATDLKEEQKMCDEDVLAQVPTFLVAGHETTSVGTAWALYALSINPHIQSTLRHELLSHPTQSPTMDDLNALPYLDALVRETLRVHTPVPGSIRVAMRDDVLPLSRPWKDKRGVDRDGIQVRKGDPIFIPIIAINRSKELWGEDAMEFKPERWQNIPEAVSAIPGVWGNMLSFLGGPRACIGYRFSLIEMKALLFALVRAFEFELAVPASDITKKQALVQQPVVVSEKEAGNQMPLLMKVYVGGDLA